MKRISRTVTMNAAVSGMPFNADQTPVWRLSSSGENLGIVSKRILCM